MKQGTGGVLQSVDRTCSILECFTLDRPEWSTSDLARQLGLPKGTMHRFLTSLEQRGYVEQHPRTRTYRLGLRLLDLSRVVMKQLDVRERCLPALRALSSATNENVNLAIRDGHEIVYLEKIESSQFLNLTLRVGSRLPLHCSSMGKVLLAFLPEPEQSQLVDELELRRFTTNTITDRAALLRELALVRERGYAICDEELTLGLVTVGAPVYNHEDRVVAAINVSGPGARMTPQKVLGLIIPELLRAAAAASLALGANRSRAREEAGHGSDLSV